MVSSAAEDTTASPLLDDLRTISSVRPEPGYQACIWREGSSPAEYDRCNHANVTGAGMRVQGRRNDDRNRSRQSQTTFCPWEVPVEPSQVLTDPFTIDSRVVNS